jgi:hypothetical protein
MESHQTNNRLPLHIKGDVSTFVTKRRCMSPFTHVIRDMLTERASHFCQKWTRLQS